VRKSLKRGEKVSLVRVENADNARKSRIFGNCGIVLSIENI
jgi:hypothetical protein